MKRIRVQNIRKKFHSLGRGIIAALSGVDLEIEAGTFFVLLGPSGCGKSTLLNIIAGIEKPDEGEIWIGDTLVVSVQKHTYLSPRERDVAMVFQSYALYPHMTVFENIAFPLKIGGVEKQEIRKKVERVALKLQISQLLQAKPSELSGGQKQRVALGRAIVRAPNVLLLDEPLSNLDALLRTSMRAELKQIQRELKVSTIYVTHDQVEAMSLGDCIAILLRGEVQQVGNPEDIYNNPRNIFVAKFVGTPPMNLLPGEMLEEVGRSFSFPTDHSLKELIVGLRPERLRVSEKEGGIFRGKLKLISSLGSDLLLYIDVGNHELIARVSKISSLHEGDIVKIGFEDRDMFYFAKSDGRRLLI